MNPLSYFSTHFMLRYDLPIAAMALIGGFYLLRRNTTRKFLGRKPAAIVQYVLLAALAVTALLAVENYRATDYYRYDSYLNAYEFYHYYIGSKYGREVGYVDMYAASLIADAETGMKWKHQTGTIRDLSSGRHVNYKEFLDKANEYKAKFTPERWEEFKKDIVWFKAHLVQSRWSGILRDKGYNGTPVWTMLVGGLLSNTISTDNEWGMMFLALLDPLLILITFIMVVWAFGPRTAFLMIVLLGTSYVMKWWHMKGAYLRTDWAMCLVMSACLIRKNKFTAAGIVTGYAALSRIFPAIMVFGVGAKLFWDLINLMVTHIKKLHDRLEMAKRPLEVRLLFRFTVTLFICLLIWRSYTLLSGVIIPFLCLEERSAHGFFGQLVSGAGGYSPLLQVIILAAWVCIGVYWAALFCWGFWKKVLERRYAYFFLAFAATTVGLLGVSSLYWHGTDYWAQYRAKISKHNEDISTWRVGYKYIFIADFGDDFSYIEKPLKAWQPRSHSSWFNEKKTEWWTTQVYILLLTLFACMTLKDYRAYLLGFIPMFFLISPTYYYYIMLLVPLLFFAPRIEHGRYAAGMCFMYLTGMSGYWFYTMWQQNYGTYYWISFQIMVLLLYMLFLAYIENIKFAAEWRSARRAYKMDASIPDTI